MAPWNAILALGLGALPLSIAGARPDLFIRPAEISFRQMDFSHAVTAGPVYNHVDFKKLDFNNPSVVSSNHAAYVLGNERIEMTVLPRMGRIVSLVDRATGHNQLWTNPVARPIGAHNDTGWWLVLGGIEFTVPRGEHGTTWSLPWRHQLLEDSRRRKAVRMETIEPATGLRQSIVLSVYPRLAFCEVELTVRNPTSTNVPFAHWVNPMLAPGGKNELTPRTELVVPCTAMIVPDRDFNRWIPGGRRQSFVNNPLCFIENWRAPGDLLAESLSADFYGAFSHEANEGIARVFDRHKTPGMDIWSWGFPPPPARQREYSLAPNLGYVEMWGGTATDYSDEARRILSPGEAVNWKEFYIPFHGTGGFTYADTNLVASFQWRPREQSLSAGVLPLGDLPGSLEIRQGGRALSRARLGRSRPTVLNRRLESSRETPELFVHFEGREPIRIPARVL